MTPSWSESPTPREAGLAAPAWGMPHALVVWMTMLVATRDSDRRCKLRPCQRAIVALVYLREHTTLAKIAAGFGISESTAHSYTSAAVHLLAERDTRASRARRSADSRY